MTPASYKNTRVASHRSQEQVEKLLRLHGVEAFRWTSVPGKLGLEFQRPSEHGPVGYYIGLAYEEERLKAQYLRALHWYLKAKLEAVDFGLEAFDRAFMPNLIIGPDRTLGDEVQERVDQGLLGQGLPLLPEGRGDRHGAK